MDKSVWKRTQNVNEYNVMTYIVIMCLLVCVKRVVHSTTKHHACSFINQLLSWEQRTKTAIVFDE